MESMSEVLNVEKIFNQNVFTLGKMKERLPRKVFNEVKNVMDHGGELSLAAADVVAKAMKDWAVENGATHYTHWFQPLTGVTAEKHDSFVTNPDDEQIRVDLSLVPANITKIAFTVTIYDAEVRRQNFGQVNNAFIRIYNEETGEELLRYDLGEDFSQ